MAWKQNPDTGESYQVEDPRPGEGSESGYVNPTAGGKQKVPEYKGPLPNQQAPNLPPPVAPNVGPQLPQNGNGPMFPDSAFANPVAYNGGYYNPTTAPFGYDMSTPGVREQFWNNNQSLWMQSPQMDWANAQLGQFSDPWYGETWNQNAMNTFGQPGAGQQFWNGISGSFNQMTPAQQQVQGGYKGPNNAQEAYGMTKGMMPGSLQPQFDAYYDRMRDKAMSAVNSQSAARGSYGSNSALNGSIGAALDVEAQRAKAGTDFALADSQNQQGWAGLLGNAARGADLSGLGIFGANLGAANQSLDRIKTFGDLAFRAEEMGFNKDKAKSDLAFGIDDARRQRLDSGISTALGLDQQALNRVNSAFDAAGGAQDAREDRVNELYGQNEDFSNDIMGYFSQHYDQLLNADQTQFDNMLETMIAQTADERGWNQQQQERIFRDAKAAWDAVMGDKANQAAGGTSMFGG